MDKYIERLYKKYNHIGIEDDLAYLSEDCRTFCSYMKRQFKASAERRNLELAYFNAGHYYVSGFFRKPACGDATEKFVYFNFDIPRYGMPIDFDKHYSIMIRKAENCKDFTGKENHYTNLENLMLNIEILFNED